MTSKHQSTFCITFVTIQYYMEIIDTLSCLIQYYIIILLNISERKSLI